MNSQIFTEGQLIYEAHIQFTGIVEYGVSLEAISSGEIPPPLAGARFDQRFTGTLTGPVLTGEINGIDHLYVSADSRFQLHIHASIQTDDGHNISFESQGVTFLDEETRETQLRAAVSLFTSSPGYRWLNQRQIWAVGTLDPVKGKAFVRAYAA